MRLFRTGRMPMLSPARKVPRGAAPRRQPQVVRTGPRPVRAAEPPRPTSPSTLKIQRRGGGWALLVDGIDEPAWVVSSKKRAVRWARDAARYHQCALRVFRMDGTLQREQSWAS